MFVTVSVRTFQSAIVLMVASSVKAMTDDIVRVRTTPMEISIVFSSGRSVKSGRVGRSVSEPLQSSVKMEIKND